MKLGNLAKSLLGIPIYPTLVALNIAGEILVRVTEPWCRFFEKDIPAK